MDKNIPKRRFKEFVGSGEWEEKNVTEIGDIFIGLVTTMTKYYTNKGTLLIRNSNIKNNYFEFGKDPIYLEESFAIKNMSRQHKLGDVITVHTGDVGTSAVITEKEEGSIGFATIVTRPNRELIKSNYLSVYLNTNKHRNWAINVSTGDGRTNYNLRDYYKLNIPIPYLAEQEKIGDFFQRLDKLIDINREKLEKLKDSKSAYLEEMFPKEGEVYPSRRFDGFKDPWEEKKLGDVVDITMGQSPSSSNYTENPKDHILVQGNADMKKGKVYPRVWTTQITKKAYKNDLILSVRAPVGDIGKTEYDVVLGRGVAAIKGNEFIFQFLNKMKEEGYWKRISTGSTFESINSNDIKSSLIFIPSIEEKEKIGDFLKKLDEQIELQERKIEKLENMKKAYLAEMFI